MPRYARHPLIDLPGDARAASLGSPEASDEWHPGQPRDRAQPECRASQTRAAMGRH
ncbi:hypothetical protein L810_4016 [Burkholderia sp. AU4i]|nr:hypothetical protein L810_4016 [Burkholderia sp. AU4i]